MEQPRLRIKYENEVKTKLQDEFKYRNVMQIPKVEKIVLNCGLGEDGRNAKLVTDAATEMGIISGQKVVVTKAKMSIANWKLREGMSSGCKVTLRGTRMYEFLDKLVNIVLPRIRDFRGINPNCFDGRGNFSMGITEQFVFPEINYDSVDNVHGMNIVVVTTAETDEEARYMLKTMGMPFKQA